MNADETYPLVSTKKYELIFAGCWFVLGSIFFIYMMLFSRTSPSAWALALYGFLTICSLFLGCLAIGAALLTKLTISGEGIIYENVFFLKKCKWRDTTGFVSSSTELILTTNENIEVVFKHRFLGLVDTADGIPLYLFIKHWDRDDYLLRDPILLRVVEYAPHLAGNNHP
jgi:hypothetical protein